MTLHYTSVDRILGVLPDVLRDTHVTSADLYNFAVDAEALVDGKLAARYPVPITGVAPLLSTIATDLAIYRLLTLRLFTGEASNDSPWPDRYKESLGLLDLIADGALALVVDGETVTDVGQGSGVVWSNRMGFRPTFNERRPEAQRVDPGKWWLWH